MRVKIICIAMLFSLKIFANDTLLINVFLKDYYYNFIQTKDGDVFVSSNSGLFKLNSGQLEKVGENKGYVKFQNGKFVESTYFAVDTHFRFKNLLPRSYDRYPEQSIQLDNFIYVISKGSIFVFKMAEYKTLMNGSSVRCFTNNSIGSYDGIYCYGDKIELPSYTSGYIYELDSTFFICYDGLAIYKKGYKTKLYTKELTGETQIGEESLGFARNIVKLSKAGYLFSSTKGLYILSDSLDSAELIKQSETDKAPVIIDVSESEYNSTITFSVSNKLFRYGIKSKEILHLLDLKSDVLDGVKKNKGKTSSTELLMLIENSIVSVDLFSDSKSEVPIGALAHTILLLDENKVLLSSNDGAFIVDLVTEKVIHIFRGIEFNKRAVWKHNENIKLGSTNGYLKVTIDQLYNLAEEEKRSHQVKSESFILVAVAGLLLLVISISIYSYFRGRSNSSITVEPIGKDDIEEYIHNNLNRVTIDSLTDHFKISNKALYSIVFPYKPGKLITKQRLAKAEELKLRGVNIEEISKLTGFSISYLKKLKY